MITTISGVSAAGKTTLMRDMLDALPHSVPLVSITTRQPRDDDAPGEYMHVTDQEFDQLLCENAFLWHIEAHGNRYGTRRNTIDTALAEQHRCHIAIITIEAAPTLREYASHQAALRSLAHIYLLAPSEHDLRRRLIQRGHEDDVITRRINDCRDWDTRAQSSGIPFAFIEGGRDRSQTLDLALKHIRAHVGAV